MSAVPEINDDNALRQMAEQFGHATGAKPRLSRRDAQRMLGRLWEMVQQWQRKRASRRVLRDLTDDELLDIGVSRADAGREVSKSFFWD
jgi:uncharacterized protein YjiS (DUF1127 family)